MDLIRQNERKRRWSDHENDISAQKEVPCEGSWLPCKNEYKRWKKSIGSQKSKGKKEIISLGRRFVAFCFPFLNENSRMKKTCREKK